MFLQKHEIHVKVEENSKTDLRVKNYIPYSWKICTDYKPLKLSYKFVLIQKLSIILLLTYKIITSDSTR